VTVFTLSSSAAFQLKRRQDKKEYRFRRARSAGCVAALTELGAATHPAFQRKRSTRPFVRTAPIVAAALVASSSAGADQVGPYSQRTLTLGAGTVRFDGGPPDWGYFHPGSPQQLDENRGLRVRVDRGADQTSAWLGLGLAVGVADAIELGGLLPLRLTPGSDVDDPEMYGRFGFLDGDFEMGGQVTLQVPTLTDTGLGLGFPMSIHVGRRLRIDTGAELELLFSDPTSTSLDAPLAFTWDVGRSGFMGLRTGVYLWDMDAMIVPAGFHGGVAVASGHLDVSGWFMWPGFFHSERHRALEAGTFELGFGLNARID
jgi:hypothetical protein